MTLLRELNDAELPFGSMAWLGAASFEDRCLGSAQLLTRDNRLARACVLRYSTPTDRHGHEQATMNQNLLLREFERHNVEVSKRDALAYQTTSMARIMADFTETSARDAGEGLVIDISCLTKLHVATLAVWLWENQHVLEQFAIYIAYTPPLQYGWQSKLHHNGAKFSELIHAPLVTGAPDSRIRMERSAVALLGHEGARLRYALFALDVDRGFYCLSSSPELADARHIAEIENQQFLSDVNAGVAGKWTSCDVMDMDMAMLQKSVTSFMNSEPENARQVLIPFGPKPLVVQTVATILDFDESDLWISYPVVTSHSSKSSWGTGVTRIWRMDFSTPSKPH